MGAGFFSMAPEAVGMNAEDKPRRRWLAFSIRDALLVTAIAALSIGWLLDHRRLANSEIYRVGNGVLFAVRQMYEEDCEDPMPISFCYRVRPFQVSVSLAEYHKTYPTLPGRGLPDHP
jgi:hypothetical protein